MCAAALFLAGCAAPLKYDSPAGALAQLGGEWTLVSLKGRDVASRLPDHSAAPTLAIGPDGGVSGFGGINRLGSSLDLEALMTGEFSLAPMVTTRMAGPPELMDLEASYLAALASADRFSVRGDELSLSEGWKVLLRFER